MRKSLALHQLKVACVFGRSDWAGQASMFGLCRHRRAAEAVILDELSSQGIPSKFTSYLDITSLSSNCAVLYSCLLVLASRFGHQ